MDYDAYGKGEEVVQMHTTDSIGLMSNMIVLFPSFFRLLFSSFISVFFFSAIIDVVFGGQIKERKEKKHRKGDGGRRKGGGRSAGVIDFF